MNQAKLLMMFYEFSQTEAGQKVIQQGKNFLIEVALPKLQASASGIAIKIRSTSTDTLHQSNIKLNKSLNIVNNGLSLPLSYQENLSVSRISHKISNDLDIIKGQNEILFLSNSIQYFLDSHQTRTGLDRGISYALQYDIDAVCQHLKKNKDIRFPGYLLHQLTCLSRTIEELNVFYDSILNNGKVKSFEEKDKTGHKEKFNKTVGIDGKKVDYGYLPYSLQLEFLRDSSEKAQKKSSVFDSMKGLVGSKELEAELNDTAHDALFILKAELAANEELEFKIHEKLKLEDKPMILIVERT
ncbi:hypothetical protein [Acinetobacter sp. 5862]|uniref:hypothetical protein n=1 Tax=Acinetobacter sp. 5862 TaxID=2967169 RepID=UPI00211128BB|nr:hypothetical protein [Acinetobacter sp. 5862]